jgi:hypothetical protein
MSSIFKIQARNIGGGNMCIGFRHSTLTAKKLQKVVGTDRQLSKLLRSGEGTVQSDKQGNPNYIFISSGVSVVKFPWGINVECTQT